ncbi:MAG TPA: hypothetical protein VIM67_09345 [Terriglobus sp.]
MLPAIAACEGCAATPEAAAKAAMGASMVASPSGVGFRVEDIEVDPVLRRAWVRVRRCDAPERPAVLVPIYAPMRNPESTVRAATPGVLKPNVVEARQPLVHAGDRVRAVFVSRTTHMELQVQALQSGSEGQTILLLVKRPAGTVADEPERRIHGKVRADGIVEVVP